MRLALRPLLFLVFAALTAWGVWLIVLYAFIVRGDDSNDLLYWSAVAVLVVVVAGLLWAAMKVGRPFLGNFAKPSE